jgi:hypothetical protein
LSFLSRKKDSSNPSQSGKGDEGQSLLELDGAANFESGTNAYYGLVRFGSLAEVKTYLTKLAEIYRKDCERSSNVVASMYRNQGEKASAANGVMSWAKVGPVLVNSVDPNTARLEVTLQHLSDQKQRLDKVEEVLQGFKEVEGLHIPDEAAISVYLRNGAPERLIIDAKSAKAVKFSLTAEYATV